MPKTITAGMQTHLDGEVTSLATCWRITRQDGVEFFFTDHDTALTVDGDLYKADSGYKRTAIANDSTLSVDNLDIEGVFDSEEITEQDLRAGKFDYAEIKIFTVNWDDLTDGIIRMRRGRIGEVGFTEQGVFRAELRGLTQQLSQRSITETYQPECRADLGDSRCMIPIDPPDRENSTAYELDDYIKVITATSLVRFLTHANVDGEDLVTTNVPTYGAKVAIQGTTVKYGAGANEHSPTVANDVPSLVIYPNDPGYSIGGDDFCIEGYFNFKTLATAGLIGYFDGTDGWFIRYLTSGGGTLEFNTFNASSPEIVVSGTAMGIVTGTWYHIAVTRDRSGPDTIRIFVNGVEEVTETGNTETVPSPATDGFVLGGIGESPSNVRSFDGYSDECRLTIGDPVYTSGFTPLTEEFPDPGATAAGYENRIYRNIVAGTTAASQPVYDTTVGETTVDGTAEFIAEEAWMRNGEVDTVTDRTTFTLTVDFDEVRAVDDWFNGGGLQFQSGDNDGRTMEIRDWVQSSRTVTLFQATAFDVQPGDLVRLYPGCDKLLSTCRDRFDNVINFRGFPHVPGQDEFTKYPDAKTS